VQFAREIVFENLMFVPLDLGYVYSHNDTVIKEKEKSIRLLLIRERKSSEKIDIRINSFFW